MATGSVSSCQLGAASVNNARAKSGPHRTLVTQPFSPVLISSVCSDNGEEAVKLAAVVCIHCGRPARVAAFSSSGAGRSEFVEPRERRVDVCLVEDFAAADQPAVDRHMSTIRHSASKPSREVPCAAWVKTAPRLLEPMHSLDVDAEVRRDVPRRHGCMRPDQPASIVARGRWSTLTMSGVVAGSSRRFSAA